MYGMISANDVDVNKRLDVGENVKPVMRQKKQSEEQSKLSCCYNFLLYVLIGMSVFTMTGIVYVVYNSPDKVVSEVNYMTIEPYKIVAFETGTIDEYTTVVYSKIKVLDSYGSHVSSEEQDVTIKIKYTDMKHKELSWFQIMSLQYDSIYTSIENLTGQPIKIQYMTILGKFNL
jgi:hypothetical protein